MKVNICGIPHKVIYCKDEFNTDTHYGQIDYGKAIIKISEDISKEQQDEALCHEILHGILVHIGKGIGVAAEMTYQEAKAKCEAWKKKKEEFHQITLDEYFGGEKGLD